MKIAVIVATYQRTNGTTPRILNNMFQRLIKQTHKNFKVFIVGDDYRNSKEFNAIINKYKPRLNIWSKNNPKSLRNSNLKIKVNLWTSGGIYAKYEAIKKAIDEKYDIYMHLDDDDIWLSNHIKNYLNVFKEYPSVDFVYSKAKYCKTHLPKNIPDTISTTLNNFGEGIKPGNVVHSTFAFNLNTCGNLVLKMFVDRIILLKQIQKKEILETRIRAHDAYQLLTIKENNKSSILIPIVSCIKRTDGNVPK